MPKIRERIKNVKERIKNIKKPIIEYNGRKYIFSLRSLILFAVAAPISAYLIYLFFDLKINYWLHEIVVKQTVYLLNLFFNMGVTAEYNPIARDPWYFHFHSSLSNITFQTFCTGVQAICVFAGIIIFTPHSQDRDTRRDIVWRKTKALIISSLIFYIVNIIRMLIQLGLYYNGYAWNDIHFSISAASSFIAAIIVLLMHKWMPEFIISIIYVGTLVTEPIKKKRKEKVRDTVMDTNKVELNVMRKILRMDKKKFPEEISTWSKQFGYIIEDDYIIVPDQKISKFIELLMQNKPFVKDIKKD
ncbi:MAG: archaeosortase H [Candidatus Thorarchaeota archaeon]